MSNVSLFWWRWLIAASLFVMALGLSLVVIPQLPEMYFNLILFGNYHRLIDAALPRQNVPEPPVLIGLCAVIAEVGGVKSYWAMTHRSAQPDFHDPACFAAKLGPRKAA